MNKHHEYDVLPHMREAQEKLPWTVEAMIWKSQFVVDWCIHSVFSGGLDDLDPGAKSWATEHSRFQRGVAYYLSNLIAGQKLEPKKKSYYRNCESHAWVEKAFFHLATGVHNAAKDSDNPREHILASSPCVIWEMVRCIEYQNTIKKLGILEGKPPKTAEKLRGKVFRIEAECRHLDDLTFNLDRDIKSTVHVKHGTLPLNGVKGEEVHWEENPRFFLLLTAHYLAQDDIDFRLDYWNPFQEWAGRHLRKMRRSSNYHTPILLPDGAYAILEQKRKGSRARK
ncbi:MAG: hypothetical protein Kow00121_36700 [Elainellaceae cyanobacterium]